MAVKHSCPFNLLVGPPHPRRSSSLLTFSLALPSALSVSPPFSLERSGREETNGSRTVVLHDEHRSLISGIPLRAPKSSRFGYSCSLIVVPFHRSYRFPRDCYTYIIFDASLLICGINAACTPHTCAASTNRCLFLTLSWSNSLCDVEVI